MSLLALYDVPAPAKLNLFLHVVGRRADGYHLLRSLFVPIDWADRLHFERRGDARLARHDLAAALPSDDLCLRAARALQQASGTSLGADISIDKRVPWGAGLGGGSSDAASTLLALNRLWDLRWPRERLAAIGVALGADVPFFLGAGPALVEGIGERLTPVALAGAEYLVVKPEAALATRDVFTHPLLARHVAPGTATGAPTSAPAGASGEAAILAGSFEDNAVLHPGYGRNDLQPSAEALCPEVAEAARWLEARFGASCMSGSGSAVFARVDELGGMAASPETVAQALDDLRRVHPRWTARRCRSLPEHPLAHW